MASAPFCSHGCFIPFRRLCVLAGVVIYGNHLPYTIHGTGLNLFGWKSIFRAPPALQSRFRPASLWEHGFVVLPLILMGMFVV